MKNQIGKGVIVRIMVALIVGGVAGCYGGRTSVASAQTSGASTKQVELRHAMRELWSDHMQWTYATVDAFFHNQQALQPTLDRLLRNQADIGNAIAPYYGKDAAKQLTDLLTTHI